MIYRDVLRHGCRDIESALGPVHDNSTVRLLDLVKMLVLWVFARERQTEQYFRHVWFFSMSRREEAAEREEDWC